MAVIRAVVGGSAVLLAGAVSAWILLLVRLRGMAGMSGTMGLGLAAFVGTWVLMMAAMMLPAAAPVAVLYTRAIRTMRPLRTTSFAAGYLLAWGVAALPAFALAWLVERLAGRGDVWPTAVAVVSFAVCGAYQLTPFKDRCLRHCRSPIAHLMQYASYRGPTRDLRAGAHHGAYCLGCCWALMLVLVVVGLMNVGAMAALTGVVVAEKLAPWGRTLSKAFGLVALGLAVAAVWVPSVAPGLHP